MSEPLLGCQPLGRIPLQAARNEVHKRIVWRIPQLYHDVFKSLLLLLGCQHVGLGLSATRIFFKL